MKRRGFLELLGLAPVAVVNIAEEAEPPKPVYFPPSGFVCELSSCSAGYMPVGMWEYKR